MTTVVDITVLSEEDAMVISYKWSILTRHLSYFLQKCTSWDQYSRCLEILQVANWAELSVASTDYSESAMVCS